MARLNPDAQLFYGHVYESARAGCLSGLCASGCNEEEAEEIFSIAVEKVMARVEPIDRGFAEAQMVNYLKDACRSRWIDQRHCSAHEEVGLNAIESYAASAAALEDEVTEHERIALVVHALGTMPDRDKQVFCLRHFRGWEPAEIQRRFCMTRRTYRKVIGRANARVVGELKRG